MRRAVVACAALLAACGPMGVRSGAGLCALAPEAEVSAALGVVVVAAEPGGGDHPACRWNGATSADGIPRYMTADVWRGDALLRARPPTTGAMFFEEQLHLLEKDFGRTRVIGDAGAAAVYGFGEVGAERFTGGIIIRRRNDVLAMRIEGADPAAFETVARRIAEKM
jgi:hypothetical protein